MAAIHIARARAAAVLLAAGLLPGCFTCAEGCGAAVGQLVTGLSDMVGFQAAMAEQTGYGVVQVRVEAQTGSTSLLGIQVAPGPTLRPGQPIDCGRVDEVLRAYRKDVPQNVVVFERMPRGNAHIHCTLTYSTADGSMPHPPTPEQLRSLTTERVMDLQVSASPFGPADGGY